MTIAIYHNPRVDPVVHSRGTSDFTRQDWLALAMVALDHAGLPVQLQDHIQALLPRVDGEEGGR